MILLRLQKSVHIRVILYLCHSRKQQCLRICTADGLTAFDTAYGRRAGPGVPVSFTFLFTDRADTVRKLDFFGIDERILIDRVFGYVFFYFVVNLAVLFLPLCASDVISPAILWTVCPYLRLQYRRFHRGLLRIPKASRAHSYGNGS